MAAPGAETCRSDIHVARSRRARAPPSLYPLPEVTSTTAWHAAQAAEHAGSGATRMNFNGQPLLVRVVVEFLTRVRVSNRRRLGQTIYAGLCCHAVLIANAGIMQTPWRDVDSHEALQRDAIFVLVKIRVPLFCSALVALPRPSCPSRSIPFSRSPIHQRFSQ